MDKAIQKNTRCIVHITESLASGVLSSVSLLSSGQAEQGFEVNVIYSSRSETPEYSALVQHFHQDVKLHEVPMKTSISIHNDVYSVYKLIRILYKLKPEVVHLHSTKAGALGRVARLFYWRPVGLFYSPRGLAFLRLDYSEGKRKLFYCLERLLAVLPGTLVGCSMSELQLIQNKLKVKKALLLENAIDVEALAGLKKKRHKKTIIVTSGRISRQKAPWRFAALARRFIPDGIEFVWVGDGKQEDIDKWLSGSGVQITGWKSRQEVQEIVRSASVFALLSDWEGMPISLIEAQVMGVPCLATDCVGNRDVVEHEVTGLVANNENELESLLEALLNDAAKRNTYSRQAKKTGIKRFGKARLIEGSLALYGMNVQKNDEKRIS